MCEALIGLIIICTTITILMQMITAQHKQIAVEQARLDEVRKRHQTLEPQWKMIYEKKLRAWAKRQDEGST